MDDDDDEDEDEDDDDDDEDDDDDGDDDDYYPLLPPAPASASNLAVELHTTRQSSEHRTVSEGPPTAASRTEGPPTLREPTRRAAAGRRRPQNLKKHDPFRRAKKT